MTYEWRLAPMEEATPFWTGLQQGVLQLPWCDACQAAVYYPRSFCPRCHADVTGWRRMSGRGSVYAFGIEHRSIAGCDLEPPFVVALVDLEEGCRMVTNILDEPDAVEVGMEVEVVFSPTGSGQMVPRFRRA
jgi:uncharacterized OB-fold protein